MDKRSPDTRRKKPPTKPPILTGIESGSGCEKRVVVWHGSAGLYCYDHDGNEALATAIWCVQHIWGYASIAVFLGGSIIMNAGPES